MLIIGYMMLYAFLNIIDWFKSHENGHFGGGKKIQCFLEVNLKDMFLVRKYIFICYANTKFSQIFENVNRLLFLKSGPENNLFLQTLLIRALLNLIW